MIVRNFLFAVAVAVVLHCAPSGVLAQSLYTLPDGIETRWASAENPLGKRGEGAQTNGGRRGGQQYRSRRASKSHWLRFAAPAVRSAEYGQQSATEARPCCED